MRRVWNLVAPVSYGAMSFDVSSNSSCGVAPCFEKSDYIRWTSSESPRAESHRAPLGQGTAPRFRSPSSSLSMLWRSSSAPTMPQKTWSAGQLGPPMMPDSLELKPSVCNELGVIWFLLEEHSTAPLDVQSIHVWSSSGENKKIEVG